MGIFASIMDKIFHHGGTDPSHASSVADAPQATTPAAAPSQSAPATQPVDVESVLIQMASNAPGSGGNWRTSIVDLLKVLNLDSSLDARKTLATELNVHVGADGTAEENIALHKAVMQKLADNGGTVPDSLKG
jgi:hypothetical protein